jgi:hypothetical protein
LPEGGVVVSAPIGEVRVEVRGDTSKVDPDIEKGLRAAADDADPELKRIGRDFGDAIGESMEKELQKHGPDIAHAVERGTSKNPAKVDWNLDTDRNTIQREVASLGRNIEREVRTLSGGGGKGPFGAIGGAIADAVGAGFNISGRSPLIAVLVPLFGAIAELVIGAIQAINALSAALFIIPGAIAAIILQVGTLFIAFQGVGTAIQGAFAAKNADELKKAIEGLTPSTQAFVKSLLPLKDFFKTLHDIVQENFFYNFGNSITAVAKTLGPVLTQNLGDLAAALGGFARGVVTFFADPAFLYFIRLIIPATVRWLESFGPALNKFLFGLTQIGIYLTPFFEWVGSSLTSSLASLGDWLNRLSSDPEFLQWLEEMKVTFGALGKVIDSVAFFLFALVRAVNRAGGNGVLEDIANQLNAIGLFLSTDLGTKAIEGLIHVVELLAFSFTFLILGALALLTAFELILEFLRHGLWPWLTDVITNTIPEFFHSVGGFLTFLLGVIGTVVSEYVKALGQAFVDLGLWILKSLTDIGGWISTHVARWVGAVVDFFGSIPNRFWNALGDMYGLLKDAGARMIQGLIDGIISMYHRLGQAAHDAAAVFLSFWPLSPAKEGPLSGAGDPMFAGQKLIDRLVTGMEMEQPALAAATNNMASTVVFGPNSVQAVFNGQLPSNNQAMALGGALGGGIASRLAARDTRLAVRAMA